MKNTFEFKSVGKKHEDENGFFEFLVKEQFNLEKSRVVQWCEFNGLKITINAASEEIIEWGKKTIENGFETPTGYKYIMKN